ncbi:MAG: IS1096 element passenger TnpR family protein [Gaiellaceae bacterium]
MKAKIAYVFKAQLVGMRGVSRKIAIRGDQSLVDLHEALREAFGWSEDHLFAFWLDGGFWGDPAKAYKHPFAIEWSPVGDLRPGPKPKSADLRIDRLRLKPKQRIAYVFDFGDEWRVKLTLIEVVPAEHDPYPAIIESRGEAPPQYPDFEADAA